ncbi:MAG: hypothetical protein WC522_05250 [Candidatus Omnitrophota bacterium]
MKKMMPILISIVILAVSAPLFAADSDQSGASAAASPAHKKSIFNHLSDYFSMFDRPFKRPGNKQTFFTATADWLKNIDKN